MDRPTELLMIVLCAVASMFANTPRKQKQYGVHYHVGSLLLCWCATTRRLDFALLLTSQVKLMIKVMFLKMTCCPATQNSKAETQMKQEWEGSWGGTPNIEWENTDILKYLNYWESLATKTDFWNLELATVGPLRCRTVATLNDCELVTWQDTPLIP